MGDTQNKTKGLDARVGNKVLRIMTGNTPGSTIFFVGCTEQEFEMNKAVQQGAASSLQYQSRKTRT